MSQQQRPLSPDVAALQLVFNAALEHCEENTASAFSAMAGPSLEAIQAALWAGEDEHQALAVIQAEQKAKGAAPA